MRLVILLLSLESASVLAYALVARGWFYTRTRPHSVDAGEPAAGGIGTPPRKVLHPVLGFANRPGLAVTAVANPERLRHMVGEGLESPWLELAANNHGYFSERDYPTAADDELFVVGVFGGSAAQWFALQAGPELARQLAGMPGLEGRRVEVLCFAQGGFKQPQTLHALTYFAARGQRFDLILTIDGFNEVALAAANLALGFDPALPSTAQLVPLVELAGAGEAPSAVGSRWCRALALRAAVLGQQARAGDTRSAAVWLVQQVRLSFTRRSLALAEAELSGSAPADGSPLYLLAPAGRDPDRTPREAVAVWARASRLTAAVAEALGTPHLHVIQPNQYHSAHRFSPAERRLALNERSPYREAVHAGYPLLLDEVDSLAASGVHVISAVDVFDAVDEPVYADDCCHYTQLGNEILARRIAHEIGPLLGPDAP